MDPRGPQMDPVVSQGQPKTAHGYTNSRYVDPAVCTQREFRPPGHHTSRLANVETVIHDSVSMPTLASKDAVFQVPDHCVTELVNVFPAQSDILPLQVTFPVVTMHPYVEWIVNYLAIFQHTSIQQLRNEICPAKHVYIYTDGSIPQSTRDDQNLASALVILYEDQVGQFMILGFLASRLRLCGSLFQVDYDVDSTLR